MGLIKCPDCGKQISDLAPMCINCGRPMKSNNDSTIAEIQIKLEELRQARKGLDDDQRFYDANPRLCEPCWWQGHENNINKLEKEIERLKNSLSGTSMTSSSSNALNASTPKILALLNESGGTIKALRLIREITLWGLPEAQAYLKSLTERN